MPKVIKKDGVYYFEETGQEKQERIEKEAQLQRIADLEQAIASILGGAI